MKRVREVKDLSATRLRDGDAILAVMRGSTKEPMASSRTSATRTSLRINDVPASTGYGEPVQKLFNFRDGERVVGALPMSADRRRPRARWPRRSASAASACASRSSRTASCRRAPGAGSPSRPRATRSSASRGCSSPRTSSAWSPADARALICKADELPELANPGRGVTVIKVGRRRRSSASASARAKDKDVLIAETDDGKELPVGPGRFNVTSRGGKGHALKRKTKIARVTSAEPLAPPAPPALLN